MIYRIKQYITFLLRSTNQHGVHSPFVYNLVTKCFYDNNKYQEYRKIANYRKALLKNNGSITVTDKDASTSSSRSISLITNQVALSKSRIKLLFRLVNYLDSKSILEVGTSLGLIPQAMSLGNTKAQLTTLEVCPNIGAFTQSNFKAQDLDGITFINGDVLKNIQGLKSSTYDLVFLNSNPQKELLTQNFVALLPTAHNDSVFIFNGIYRSKETTEAWESIYQHPRVTVSIDCFHLGFVFFRSEQQKEHFTIRL